MKHTAKQDSTKTLADMYRALDRQHPVTITYVKADGTETVRTVEPSEIRTTKAGAVILRAADRQSGELRTFRLDRIVSYTLHRGRYTVALPDTDQPSAPTAAPRTAAALVALELGRDERPAARYDRAA